MDLNQPGRGNRDMWSFTHTVKHVLAGARAKHKLHAARVKWWKGKQDEVMKVVRSKGLTVEEDIAAGYANVTKVARSARITVDNRLQDKLSECHEKLRIHGQLVKDYDAWIQTLNEQRQDNTLELTHADWMYFFGQ